MLINTYNQVENLHLDPAEVSDDDFPDFADWESPEFKIEGRGRDSLWCRIEWGSESGGGRGKRQGFYYLLSPSHKKHLKISMLALQIVAIISIEPKHLNRSDYLKSLSF